MSTRRRPASPSTPARADPPQGRGQASPRKRQKGAKNCPSPLGFCEKRSCFSRERCSTINHGIRPAFMPARAGNQPTAKGKQRKGKILVTPPLRADPGEPPGWKSKACVSFAISPLRAGANSTKRVGRRKVCHPLQFYRCGQARIQPPWLDGAKCVPSAILPLRAGTNSTQRVGRHKKCPVCNYTAAGRHEFNPRGWTA